MYFFWWLQVLFITKFYCIRFLSFAVFCFMKNTLLIYVPIYSCFFPVNLTLIMVLYNLTHISLTLPRTKCFLFCILLECWCSIVLLYFKWCSVSRVNVLLSDKKKRSHTSRGRHNDDYLFYSMAASPNYYYIKSSQVFKLQFTAYCTRVGFGIELHKLFSVNLPFWEFHSMFNHVTLITQWQLTRTSSFAGQLGQPFAFKQQ